MEPLWPRMARQARDRNSWPAILKRFFPSAFWRDFEARRLRDGNAARAGWTTRALVLTSLCIGWSGMRTVVERFGRARQVVMALAGRGLPIWYQGYAKQLHAAGVDLLTEVLAALRPRVRKLAGQRWRFGGWVPIAVDGSRFDLPRSRANERTFGRSGRKGSGPQLWATLLTHLPTGAIWSWRPWSCRACWCSRPMWSV